MTFLALDPGANTGWACSDPALSGAIDHRLDAMIEWRGELPERGMKAAWTKGLEPAERLKRVLGRYFMWLSALLIELKPSVLIVEKQAPFKCRSNSGCLEFRGVTFAAAGVADIALIECHPYKWREFLDGNPYDPATDHQIAAECMLAWYRSLQ